MEGTSLASTFEANVVKDRILMWEHFGNAAIRQGNWKLVKLKDKEWELYDIEKDRSELNNLDQTHPEKAKELEALWEENAHRTLIYPKPVRNKKKK